MTCGYNTVTEGGLINPNSLQVQKNYYVAILIQKLLHLLQKGLHLRKNKNNSIFKQQSETMK